MLCNLRVCICINVLIIIYVIIQVLHIVRLFKIFCKNFRLMLSALHKLWLSFNSKNKFLLKKRQDPVKS